MKKNFKWIIRTLMIGIVLVVVCFIYWRWGFNMPEYLATNEKFVAGDFEFVIEDAKTIPTGLIHSYFGYTADESQLRRGKVIDLTMSVTNKSDQALVLLDKLHFSIDQINDPKLLQILHLHFYENFSTADLYNPEVPEENIHRDLRTKLETKETKKLHFIFYCDEIENNDYIFEIGDWFGNTLVYRQIEVSMIEACDEIQTENLSIKPLEIYQNGNDYGLTLCIQNNAGEPRSIAEMLEVAATKDKIWDYMILENIIYEGQKINVSELYLEPHQEYDINLTGSNFVGSGEFYIRISSQYFRFVL